MCFDCSFQRGSYGLLIDAGKNILVFLVGQTSLQKVLKILKADHRLASGINILKMARTQNANARRESSKMVSTR